MSTNYLQKTQKLNSKQWLANSKYSRNRESFPSMSAVYLLFIHVCYQRLIFNFKINTIKKYIQQLDCLQAQGFYQLAVESVMDALFSYRCTAEVTYRALMSQMFNILNLRVWKWSKWNGIIEDDGCRNNIRIIKKESGSLTDIIFCQQ